MTREDIIINKLKEYILPERADRIHNTVIHRTNFIHVAIEDTYRERNSGALFRTCDCFGIQSASVIENKYDHKVTKIISRGAEKWIDISRYDRDEENSTLSCINNLKAQGYQIVATTPHRADVELGDFKVTQKTALLFGTELEGLSDEAIELANIRMSIPIYGFTESYNISVAAALILQNFITQLQQSDIEWKLSQEEQYELEINWLAGSIGRAGPSILQDIISSLED